MEELTWTERREASFLKVSKASWPQAPNDSTTRGMQLQPIVLHKSLNLLVSFAVLWQKLHAEPAVCTASETMSG